MAVPQAILDQLTAVQALKDTTDSDVQARQQTMADVLAAKQADQQAATKLSQDTASLADALGKLEAILSTYYTPATPPPA
jgi:septal ring factor EnvC (AmiA/AmiB activator)